MGSDVKGNAVKEDPSNAPGYRQGPSPVRLAAVCAIAALLQVPASRISAEARAAVTTFEADLLRVSSGSGGREEQSGRLSFDASEGRLVIEIAKPLHQWAVLKGNELLLYYPDSRQALRITSKTPASMPFFGVVWNCFKEDFGLAAQGYRMTRHEKKAQRLLSMWAPPASLARLVGEAVLEHEGPRLIRVEHKTARGNMLSLALFSQHTTVAGAAFPLEVSIAYGSRQGVTQETVVFRNPRFNAPLSDGMKNFAVPAGVTIKDVQ